MCPFRLDYASMPGSNDSREMMPELTTVIVTERMELSRGFYPARPKKVAIVPAGSGGRGEGSAALACVQRTERHSRPGGERVHWSSICLGRQAPARPRRRNRFSGTPQAIERHVDVLMHRAEFPLQ